MVEMESQVGTLNKSDIELVGKLTLARVMPLTKIVSHQI